MLTAVGVALLVGVAAAVDREQAIVALRDLGWAEFLGSLAMFALSLVVGGLRWGVLLRAAEPEAPLAGAISSHLSNSFISGFTPARSGEALAPLLMEERCGVRPSTGLAVVLVDRLLDALFLASALAASAFYLRNRLTDVGTVLDAMVVAIGLLGGLALLIFVLLGPLGVDRIAVHWVERFNHPWPASVLSSIQRMREASAAMQSPRDLTAALLLTVAGWICQFAYTYLLINAFTPIEWLDSAVCHTVAVAVGIVSMMPGGIGASTIGFMSLAGLMGYSWEKIAVAGILGLLGAYVVRFLMAIAGDLHAHKARSKGSRP